MSKLENKNVFLIITKTCHMWVKYTKKNLVKNNKKPHVSKVTKKRVYKTTEWFVYIPMKITILAEI